jgi:hypothetical protein
VVAHMVFAAAPRRDIFRLQELLRSARPREGVITTAFGGHRAPVPAMVESRYNSGF